MREIVGAGGVRLAVREEGVPGGPVLVAVHGYPDDHTVWDGVAAALADRFRVVRYDVRGAGASGAPAGRAGYALDVLAADLRAVAAATGDGGPIYLLGHDWGAIQCWHALTGGFLDGRVAGFTSVSGPCLEHGGAGCGPGCAADTWPRGASCARRPTSPRSSCRCCPSWGGAAGCSAGP